nr:MAG TPA: hypothetical protein [Caudoviricetes sp.]
MAFPWCTRPAASRDAEAQPSLVSADQLETINPRNHNPTLYLALGQRRRGSHVPSQSSRKGKDSEGVSERSNSIRQPRIS